MEDNIYQAPQADLSRNPRSNQEEVVTPAMVEYLEKAGKWAKLLAILGYIFSGLTVLGALGVLLAGFFAPNSGGMGIMFVILAAVYVFVAFLLFKISRFLHQYGNATSTLSDSYDEFDLIEAQNYFGRYVKWMGVMFLIIIVIMLVAVVGGILFAGYVAGI